ncbi:hypothetical protein [Dactylosporangium sp. NPDC050588]|uniref:hypothetical protein n=1 Tax=Dactylosporangium sp. NPDC050588 TaxID=3157211 RepID=UPI00340044C3
MRSIRSAARRVATSAAAITAGVAASAVGVSPAIAAPTVCEPNTVWIDVASYTKEGEATKWSVHYKNDSTPEHFAWSTTKVAEVTASASFGGTLGANASLKKIAELTLSTTTNYGLQGVISVTSTYTRDVSFSTPGKWVIYAGHYSGGGSYSERRCNSTGTVISTNGSGRAFTFDKARATGLINCANSVSDRVAADAKTKCG